MTIRGSDASPHQAEAEEQVDDPGVALDDASGGRGAVAGGVSRRSVVKAGAAAAWSVPLIQVVAAAPAHANTSPGTTITVTGSADWDDSSKKKLTTTVTVTNTGLSETQDLTITVTFDATTTATPTGVSATNATTNSTASPYVFAADTQIPAGNSRTFTLVFDYSPGNKTVKFSTSVTATNAAAKPGPSM